MNLSPLEWKAPIRRFMPMNDPRAGTSDGVRTPVRRNGLALADDAIEIVITRLDLGSKAVRAAATLLSDAERDRASRFIFDRDRRRFIVARSRLRRLIGTHLNMPPESVELVYGERGKPALPKHSSDLDLRFNISRRDDIAVYAFSIAREIGIDVEAVRLVRGVEDIVERLFSPGEKASYHALAPRHRPLGFFNWWTRKEACVKALGAGLYQPLGSFDVSLAPDEPAQILRIENTFGDACGWLLQSFSPMPGLIGAVAVQRSADGLSPMATPQLLS